MVFSYYSRLTARQKKIYRESDGFSSVYLNSPEDFSTVLQKVRGALGKGDREAAEEFCQVFLDRMTRRLAVPPVRVRVLNKRPSQGWGELHGLYEAMEGTARPVITVWMRTAQRKQVVAFRTFLRTILHELCHHLDYRSLGLGDSFHTEGFYKRESSLLHPLLKAMGISSVVRKTRSEQGASGGAVRKV